MTISMIVAMDKNNVIGSDNQMPWHLPDDLKFFKATTLGKPVVMGRKTFESIGSKPLPGRRNVIISREPNYQAAGAELFNSIEAALQALADEPEVMIMGGGQLYSQLLSQANKLYLTQVDTQVKGDTVFPKWQTHEWQMESVEHHPQDSQHAFAFDWVTWVRKTA